MFSSFKAFNAQEPIKLLASPILALPNPIPALLSRLFGLCGVLYNLFFSVLLLGEEWICFRSGVYQYIKKKFRICWAEEAWMELTGKPWFGFMPYSSFVPSFMFTNNGLIRRLNEYSQQSWLWEVMMEALCVPARNRLVVASVCIFSLYIFAPPAIESN